MALDESMVHVRQRKNVLFGVGAVGSAICELMELAKEPYTAIDVIKERCKEFGPEGRVELLHICFSYDDKFIDNVEKLVGQLRPAEVVIHSTVKPHTCERIQKRVKSLVVYSPVRGVHERMLTDLKRYTKYYATVKQEPSLYKAWLERVGLKGKSMSGPLALEYAKILVDTTYYGWLIIYAQHTKDICDREGLNWDEVWEYSEEIHRFLGNRPKMYPGTGIGGRCILENLDLLDDEFLQMVFSHDSVYRRRIKR